VPWRERWAGGGRVVSRYLGAGASLAAMRDGRCLDTTMGFTPLDGLVMATQSGSVDPGLLLICLSGPSTRTWRAGAGCGASV